jgi:hypothetical protein
VFSGVSEGAVLRVSEGHQTKITCQPDSRDTYANAFVWAIDSRVGGVPVREDAPESSPARPKKVRLPLLLRELNIDVGPKDTFELADLVAVPFRRRRSSIPTWFCA